MAIRLIVKGNNLEVMEHKEVFGRALPDQHPIVSITGLEDALAELRRLAMIVNQHQILGNREKDDQHPLNAITGLIPLIELFLRDLTGILVIDSGNPLIKRIEYQNIQVFDNHYYIMPAPDALESYMEYALYGSVINNNIVNEYRTISNNAFKLYMAKTIPNWLEVFKPADEPKLDTTDTTVSNILGTYYPWWSRTYPNKALILYEFIAPFYINRIILRITNAEYFIKTTDYTDTASETPVFSQDSNDQTVQVYLVNKWLKKIEIIILNYINQSIQSYKLDHLALVTKDSFAGNVIYRLDMGMVYNSPSAVEVLGNTLISPYITQFKYNEALKLVELSLRFEAHTQTPIPMRDVKISYHHAIGETFQDIYKRLLYLESTMESAMDAANNIAGGIAGFADTVNEIWKRVIDDSVTNNPIDRIAYAYSNITGAVQVINPETNEQYNSLNERFNHIETTHFEKYIEILNQELANQANKDQRDMIIINSEIQNITLSFEYPMNTYRLKVYLDGVKMEPGESFDYIETSPTTIRFNQPIKPSLMLDGTYRSRHLVVEYLCLNPEVNMFETGQRVLEYRPKILEAKTTLRVPRMSEASCVLPLGVNQFNIKSVTVTPDRETQYIVRIDNQLPAEYPVYMSRLVRSRLYESVDIIYRDKLNTCAMYITIENRFNFDTEYEIDIAGIELDSAGGMDSFYNRLLTDHLNALSLNKLKALEGLMAELAIRLDNATNDISDVAGLMNTVTNEFIETKRFITQLSETVTGSLAQSSATNNLVKNALFQINQVMQDIDDKLIQIGILYEKLQNKVTDLTSGSITEAPDDGGYYLRHNKTWVQVSGEILAGNDGGINTESVLAVIEAVTIALMEYIDTVIKDVPTRDSKIPEGPTNQL